MIFKLPSKTALMSLLVFAVALWYLFGGIKHVGAEIVEGAPS